MLRDSVRSTPPLSLRALAADFLLMFDQQHFKMNLAILLRPAASLVVNASIATRSYLVLALVDEETKSGSRGAFRFLPPWLLFR